MKKQKIIIAVPAEQVTYDESLRIYNVDITDYVESIINDLESNPNKDGSISPNISHWIEQKQRQLRRKYKYIG